MAAAAVVVVVVVASVAMAVGCYRYSYMLAFDTVAVVRASFSS